LRGSVPIKTDFRLGEITDSFGLYAIKLEDRTVPTDVGENLLRQMNATGELYRHFYPLMTEGEEEERVRAARAFRMAYAALLGEDFTGL
jgi:alpha-D-ribose 1-methylphosphonate 5-triphosphate synthase subunit PhnL